MKYVNKLPSHKRNSNLMATLQAGPPGQREMSIFITRPPLHPHLRGRQTGYMPLPPMHIIPSTKEEGIRKGKAISLKYQNKEDMKGKERMKGEINYTKVDKKYRREKASGQQWGKRRRWSRSWCSIWEWMYAGCSLRECVILSCLKVISYHLKDSPHLSARLQPKKTLCISLLFPLKASMILELGVCDRCLTSGLLHCPGMIWCIQG